KKNTYYSLSGWIYNSMSYGNAYFDLSDGLGYDAKFTECQVGVTRGGNTWQYTNCTFNTGDATGVKIRVVTDGNTNVSGDVWFDDISLTEISMPSSDHGIYFSLSSNNTIENNEIETNG